MQIATVGLALDSALLSWGQSTGSAWDVLQWGNRPIPHAYRSDSHYDTTNLRVSAKPARSRHFRICGDACADCDACPGSGSPGGCKCEEYSFQGGKCATTPFRQRLAH